MKRLKRISVVLMTLAMLFSATACGGSTGESEDSGNTAEVSDAGSGGETGGSNTRTV